MLKMEKYESKYDFCFKIFKGITMLKIEEQN